MICILRHRKNMIKLRTRIRRRKSFRKQQSKNTMKQFAEQNSSNLEKEKNLKKKEVQQSPCRCVFHKKKTHFKSILTPEKKVIPPLG